MVRLFCLLAVLAACGSERTPVTTKVTTLGYSHPPAIVVIARGQPELVAPWVASLRASTAAKVVAEIPREESSSSIYTELDELCKAALEAANGEPLEEIVVISTLERKEPFMQCDTKSCFTQSYVSMTVFLDTTVTAIRASSCKVLRSNVMLTSTGHSVPKDNRASVDLAEGEEHDAVEARTTALVDMQRFAEKASWKVFPTDSSIQIVEGNRILIAGPLKLGEYFLKVPSDAALKPGVRVVSHTNNSSTLEVDDEIKPEPGDELHGISDMLTVAGYTMISGGTATANGTKHGIGGMALAARWSWDHFPGMFELQFGGDLVPGIDSRHLFIGTAAGLRWPYWISPVAFVELGVGGVYQGDHGARAVAGHAGVGVGLEVRRSRWFAFADARLRAFALGDWTDSEEHPLEVTYPDSTWQTATGQLGLGFHY